MKRIINYMKEQKQKVVLAPLFKLLEATFELFVPLVMAAMIDKGIGQEDVHYILRMGLVLVALGVIGLICSVTAQYFAASSAVGVAKNMKQDLFDHIEGLSFTEMDTIGTSTLITRLTSDANQVQNGINMVLRLFLRSPFIVLGAMIMAFTIDVKAALIFAVVIPVLSVIVFGLMALTMPMYKRVQEKLDTVLRLTRENLTGVRVIRAFHKEDIEVENFKTNNALLANMQILVGRLSALMNPTTYIVINVGTILLLWTGAVRIDGGWLTQGQVIALVNYMSQILVELIKLANLIITISKTLACIKRIDDVFMMQSSMENGSVKDMMLTNDEDDIVVSMKQVGLIYKDAGEESLSNLNITVKRGQTVGIIGGTGSGKSSLVNLLPRFYDVTSGEIKVFGQNIRDYDLETLRQKIGMVQQKAVLTQGSIAENMRWGKEDATEEEIWKALEIAQAKEFVEEKEGKLDFEILQGGKNLSGGQKQRLTIARALVRKPEIVILDDSSSALDYATDAKLRHAIHEMEGNTTVFIVSQRTASIQYADQIIVLDDGKIVGNGTHDTLLQSCDVYREIYQSQFKGANA